MRRAQKRDAVKSERFFFRKSLVPEDKDEGVGDGGRDETTPKPASHDHEYTLMSIDTIVNGKVSFERCW